MFRLSLVLTVLASPAMAALSPFYDSAEKISTILQSPEVADAVGQAPIGMISNTGTAPDGADEWTVRVQDCDLLLRLTAISPVGVGKATYRVTLAGPCK